MNDIVKKEEHAPITHTQNGLSPLVQAAMNGSLDTEKMKELLEIQKDYEANEARKAYYDAVSSFKKNPPKVVKDLTNKQYGSKYSSIGNFVNTINAALSEHGLSANWSVSQDGDRITVTCTLSHSKGHSESTPMSGPPDTSGSKNALQQIKSTVTYLKLATYEAITGLASYETDDDGNSANEPAPRITPEQVNQLHSKAVENDRLDGFMKWLKSTLKVDTLEEIRADKYNICDQRLNDAIDAKNKKGQK